MPSLTCPIEEYYFDPIINQQVGVVDGVKYILNNYNFAVTWGYQNFFIENGTLLGINGSENQVVFYYQARDEEELKKEQKQHMEIEQKREEKMQKRRRSGRNVKNEI